MAVAGLEPWTLALGAAAGFACYTVVVEYGMSWTETDESPALAAAFYSTLVVTAGFWALALARGLPAGGLTVGGLWPFLVAGVAYPALFRFLYYEGIDRVGASVTAAIMGAYPAVSVLLAVVALDEGLGPVAGGGIALVVGGVVLLQLARGTDEGDVEDVVTEKLAGANPRDLVYPAAATVSTGGAFVLIDYGLARFPDPVVATAVTQTPALVLFTGWAALAGASDGRLRVGRPVLAAFVLAGGFNFVGWLSNFFALQSGSVITVVPLINTMPLLIMAITYGIQRELPRSRRVVAAVLAIVAGASLVQIGT
jgi:drug/metabolite transporter (DMT)-like permease